MRGLLDTTSHPEKEAIPPWVPPNLVSENKLISSRFRIQHPQKKSLADSMDEEEGGDSMADPFDWLHGAELACG
jgi:hypothetical protein